MANKATRSVDHKCPSCNAVLKFNPTDQNWKCEYCDSTFNLEDLSKHKKKYKEKEVIEEKPDIGEYNVYRCPDCGAEIVTDLNTSATFCVYCKNTAIIKERLTGKFEPQEIIPFKKTMDDAIKAFKQVGRKHPFMPSSFNSQKNISEIKGIYIPFWLFTSTSIGGITANAEIINHHRSGDYVYTNTKHYHITRDGKVSFLKVPNDGATKFDDATMNSIEPFNYSKLVPFNPSYLSGFLAEKYDVDSETAKADALFRMKNTVEDIFKKDIKGYSTVNITSNTIHFPEVNVEYVLLPVYLLNIKYKNKIYTFAMNGESGKLIGNMPVDKKKAFFTFFLVLVISFLICFAIFYLFIRSNV